MCCRRVSENLVYSTSWYHMYVLTPYRTALEDIMSVDKDMADLVLQHRANVRAAWAQKTGM